jgi:hypothetical protein
MQVMYDFKSASTSELVRPLESDELNAGDFLLALIKKIKQGGVSYNQYVLILDAVIDVCLDKYSVSN